MLCTAKKTATPWGVLTFNFYHRRLHMTRLVKLHRSRRHRMIAGVMGGIAEYLGWSPTLTRVMFVVLSCASVAVPGILIYIILWIMMPNAGADSYR